MATHPLVLFAHPHRWLDSYLEVTPARTWDPDSRTWSFRPEHIDDVAPLYLRYLLGRLASGTLRRLNAEWYPDDDAVAGLHRDLPRYARAAGEHVGVRFTPGRSRPRHVIAGELSTEWLERNSRKAINFALDVWDPVKAKELHDRAVRMGNARLLDLTVDDLRPLEGMSISLQAKALGCSPRHISKLRKALREQNA